MCIETLLYGMMTDLAKLTQFQWKFGSSEDARYCVLCKDGEASRMLDASAEQ